MLTGLIFSAFLLGLAGGLHCLSMCGAVCAAVGVRRQQDTQTQGSDATVFGLHAGRTLAYSGLGALAGTLVQSMAWMTEHLSLLKPLWAMLHAGIFVWGLMLMLLMRQPRWLTRVAQPVWQQVQWAGRSTWRSTLLGTGWFVMPCGLMYSALLLASLSGGAWQGALVMLAFALPTVLWLLGMQGLLQSTILRKLSGYQVWSRRLAGLMLAISAGWALWMHMAHGIQAIC